MLSNVAQGNKTIVEGPRSFGWLLVRKKGAKTKEIDKRGTRRPEIPHGPTISFSCFLASPFFFRLAALLISSRQLALHSVNLLGKGRGRILFFVRAWESSILRVGWLLNPALLISRGPFFPAARPRKTRRIPSGKRERRTTRKRTRARPASVSDSRITGKGEEIFRFRAKRSFSLSAPTLFANPSAFSLELQRSQVDCYAGGFVTRGILLGRPFPRSTNDIIVWLSRSDIK